MKEDAPDTAQKAGGGRMLPGIVSCCLLLCLGAGAFILWNRHAERQKTPPAQAAAQQEEIGALRRQKAALEEMSRLEPCVLRQKLGLPPQAATGAGVQLPPASVAESATAPVPPRAPAAAAQDGAGPPPPDPAAANNESADRVENATVFIISEVASGLSTGTGFFVAPDMVLTNAHVVGNAPSRVMIINRKLGAPVPAVVVSTRGGQRTGERDYALLRVPGQSIQPLSLRDTPRRTEKINAWGYPHAISREDPKYQALMRGQMPVAPELVFSDGVVSAIIERAPPLIAHTAPLSQGNSGGPLTDAAGLVVGVNTLISLDDASYRQTSIALPASDFIGFLRQNGVAVSLIKR